VSAPRGRSAPRIATCECGGRITSYGGYIESGGHAGEVWGGNCDRCGRGYGDAEDDPFASLGTPPTTERG
jgi:hypothetical protein